MQATETVQFPQLAAGLNSLIIPVQEVTKRLGGLAASLALGGAGGLADASAGSNSGPPVDGGSTGGGGLMPFPNETLFTSILESFIGLEDGGLAKLFDFDLKGKKEDGKEGKKKADNSSAVQAIADADKSVADAKAQTDEERVASDAKAWGKMIGNAMAGSKKLRKIQKAMAIGAVVIDTATGIAKAFAQHGFPAGIVPAAAIAAQGAIQIATIKGQAHDGLSHVPSTGTYLLEQGERVVDKRLNQDLTHYLAGRKAGDSFNRQSAVTNSPTVNLTINGDPDPDAVRANRGAMESMIREIFAEHALASPFD
jgi:hypothetical protein